MKVLIVGGGGREHAIAWKLVQTKRNDFKLYCAPGNAGIAEYAKCIQIPATDLEGLKNFALKEHIDLTIVGMDDPLIMGIVDLFEEAGLRIFGPVQCAAMIEGSKVFSKNFMKKYGIPTASYQVFEGFEGALEYARGAIYPLVIKVDGPALGKGVAVVSDYEQAEQSIRSFMLEKKFGSSGERIVVEEFLEGQEVSVLAFSDGETIKTMLSAQDHKRALDGDCGSNTGGMGAVCPSPYYHEDIDAICMEKIYLPTLKGLLQEDRCFRGVLFFGLILTKEGPKVMEYNCRFGDPETQVVLPLLKTDLLEIINSCLEGTLDKQEIVWRTESAACIVMASKGYPDSYQTGYEITGFEKAKDFDNRFVFHAGTMGSGQEIRTNGGRVLGVTGIGADLHSALETAYGGVRQLHFEGAFYRSDIGRR